MRENQQINSHNGLSFSLLDFITIKLLKGVFPYHEEKGVRNSNNLRRHKAFLSCICSFSLNVLDGDSECRP